MKKHDITNDIVKLHEESLMKELVLEVKDDLRTKDLHSYQRELDDLLDRISNREKPERSNVVSFKPSGKQNNKIISSFYSVELLAAAGESIDVWHSRPIIFSEFGFILDIRMVLDSSDEVELYLSPISDDVNAKSEMEKAFSHALNSNINISVECDGVHLLDGSLYVDATGLNIEGAGKLDNQDFYSSVKGRLAFHILSEK